MQANPEQSLLSVSNLKAWYGKSQILNGVNLKVQPGEIVCMTGRNGAGRSTTCKAIMGLVTRTGEITFKGQRIDGAQVHEVARAGIGFVPEERLVFSALTVRQNLELGERSGVRSGNWNIEEALKLFPNLRNRADVAAGSLSGGEQQMLSMCRALMGNPELLIVDEPTEGLAPAVVEIIADLLQEVVRRGAAVILVEQKLPVALRISNRLYVVGHGQTVFEGTPDALRAADDIRREWLEV